MRSDVDERQQRTKGRRTPSSPHFHARSVSHTFQHLNMNQSKSKGSRIARKTNIQKVKIKKNMHRKLTTGKKMDILIEMSCYEPML
jgi:hypothetical protein